MSTPAVTTDSATVETPNLSVLTPAIRESLNKSGNLPSTQDSAPAKDEAVADSAPQTKTADTASDSATEQAQKPHLKTKEDTERRFKELLDARKAADERAERFEKELRELRDKSAPRETKQESQPAAEVYKPLDAEEFFKDNPKASYEDFVRTSAKHEAKWEVRQELAAENQKRQLAEAQKELTSKVTAAREKYGTESFDSRVAPASKALTDSGIHPAVQSLINDSPVFADLLFALGEPTALADLIQTAKTNPTAAIRKITTVEALIMQELAKPSEDVKRDDAGKFTSKEKKEASEPVSKAPKPPSEVGGKSVVTDDGEVSAAKAGDFRSFKTAADRAYVDRHK